MLAQPPHEARVGRPPETTPAESSETCSAAPSVALAWNHPALHIATSTTQAKSQSTSGEKERPAETALHRVGTAACRRARERTTLRILRPAGPQWTGHKAVERSFPCSRPAGG